MNETQYSVFMQTPLGRKQGVMTASVNQNVLKGWLDILGHREPFEGTIDPQGICTISGTFITLMRTVSFVATGKITASSVNLQMREERNVFELTGIPCMGREEIEE